jgi:hypothetical protein
MERYSLVLGFGVSADLPYPTQTSIAWREVSTFCEAVDKRRETSYKK